MKKGDRVKLKGREPHGVIRAMSADQWVRVDWDEGKEGPKYVHELELELTDA